MWSLIPYGMLSDKLGFIGEFVLLSVLDIRGSLAQRELPKAEGSIGCTESFLKVPGSSDVEITLVEPRTLVNIQLRCNNPSVAPRQLPLHKGARSISAWRKI